MNIANLFHDTAEKYPDNIAIIEKNNSISYRELQKQVIQTAALFESKGIRKGDRILVFVPMSIDLYRVILAIFHCGATAVFLDEWVSKKRMEICCELADCQGFIGVWKARIFSWFSKGLRGISVKLPLKCPRAPLLPFFAPGKSLLIPKGEPRATAKRVKTEDSALITFTTGSTGIPKAADRTHGFLKAQFDVLKEKINPTPGEIAMPVLPIVLLINLASGVTSVIAEFNGRKPQTWKPENTLNQIKKHRVSRITASPFFIKELAKMILELTGSPTDELVGLGADSTHRFIRGLSSHLPHLKQIFTGGAPVFPDEAKLYVRAFPNTNIQILYGSTEAEPISGIDAPTLANAVGHGSPLGMSRLLPGAKKGSRGVGGLAVGKIHPKTRLKIIPVTTEDLAFDNQNDFEKIALSTGEIGEIVVAGDHVLKQYFNNEKAWKENKIPVEKEVWHRTGDSGFLGENGDLFLTGRCKQLIRTEAGWLSPFIYENRLQSLPEIEIGTSLSIDNQNVIVIEPKINLSSEKAKKAVEEAFKNEFDRLIILKKIPRDPRHNSKIEYGKMRELIAG